MSNHLTNQQEEALDDLADKIDYLYDRLRLSKNWGSDPAFDMVKSVFKGAAK